MSAPSMVSRSGDSLVIRSVVSGNRLYVEDADDDVTSKESSTTQLKTSSISGISAKEDIENKESLPSSKILEQNRTTDEDLPQCKVKRNYACNLCNYFTQNPRQHLHHLRDVHKEKVKIYECKDCLYASRHFQKLARHMRIVHDKDETATNQQNHNNNSDLKVPTLRRSRKRTKRPIDEMYEEDYADSTIFDDFIDEPEKERTISGPVTVVKMDTQEESKNLPSNNNNNNNKTENKLKCSLCPFTTRHQGHLTRHERQDHIKTRFFRCVKCSYVTHIKARFTKHVKYHSMPMIKCDLCDFRTPYKWNLDRHNKNHNGHGAFKCCACNFTADIKQSLTVHEINHHVPPVGQAAAAGLGVGRRRNKVGASDSNLPTVASSGIINNHDHHNDLFIQISNSRPIKQELSHTMQQQQFNNTTNNNNNKSTNSSLVIAKKKCRPIPNLIPIQNTSQGTLKLFTSPKYTLSNEAAILSPINISQQDLNDLCAKSVNSSLRDFTSLFDDQDQDNIHRYNDVVEITAIKNIEPKNSLSPQTIALQKKNASFFDKLKEKLMTNALPGDGTSLTCRGCGHIAKCLSEMATHQKQCGKCTEDIVHEQLVSHFSSTRCQYCRQRCKSSADLIIHMQRCSKANNTSTNDDDNSNDTKEPHPMENKVFVWNSMPESAKKEEVIGVTNEESSINTDDSTETTNGLDLSLTQPETSNSTTEEISIHVTPSKPITHGTDLDLASSSNGKRVFKCPHCSFWATTASRFHVHIVGHLNKKPFECSLCSYRSNWRWDITKHIRLKSVRDSAHQMAKVLMTDETGRRNYSKYNKYLMQMKETSLSPTVANEKLVDNGKKSRGATTGNMITTQGNDEESIFTKLPPGIKVTRSVKTCDNNELNNNEASLNVMPSSNNTSAIQKTIKQEVVSPNTLNSSAANTKRSLWKCKKCNFRDVDRQVLLQHVKEHYIQQRYDKIVNDSTNSSTNHTATNQQVTTESVGELVDEAAGGASSQTIGGGDSSSNDDEASVNTRGGGGQAPFRCGHCHQVSNWKHVIQRHCRLKHRGDIRVLTGDSEISNINQTQLEEINSSDNQCVLCPFKSNSATIFLTHMEKHSSQSDIAIFRCIMCTFNATEHQEFISHLALHNIETKDIEAKLLGNMPSKENIENGKRYKCISCPYVSNSKNQFYYHKQFHKPRGAQYKCNICSYNVTRKHLLQQHLKVHGNVTKTDCLREIPIVWIQFENEFIKKYKCPQCPETSLNKIVIEEHEIWHENVRTENVEHHCTNCTFGTNNLELFETHLKYHQGVFGTLHCLVDEAKSDEEQISQLSKVLRPFEVQENDDKHDDKEIYFCDNCPARFLCETEYTHHLKYHKSKSNFRCPCCNYSINEKNTLTGHLKVHSEEYQEQSKVLQTLYRTNQDHKCPRTAILMDVPEINGPAWIVVSMNSPPKLKEDNDEKVIPKKYYRCKQCPEKFYKFPALKYHKKLHASDNPFKCTQCNYSAKTESGLLKHDHAHNHIDSDPDIENPVEQSTEISEALIPQATTPLYVDEQFGILMHGSPEFIYPTYVKNGRVKEKRYKCHKCPSAFEKREQYKTHLTLHGSKQKYRCKLCDYSVKYYANYVQHLRKHKMNEDAHTVKLKNHDQNDEQPVPTSTAPTPADVVGPLKLSIADRQALMILQQRRSNDPIKENNESERKLYPCPSCPYSNIRRDSIDNHIKRHISIGGITSNFTCTYCDYSVPQSHFLREHVKIHFLPLKTNKLEAYMCYGKIQIWAKNENSENETKSLVFEDDSDLHIKRRKFNPPVAKSSDCVDDDEDDLDVNDKESIVVKVSNGEVFFANDNNINDTKDNL